LVKIQGRNWPKMFFCIVKNEEDSYPLAHVLFCQSFKVVKIVTALLLYLSKAALQGREEH